MSDHSVKYPRRCCPLALCRSALSRGYLIRSGRHWAFGSRLFHAATVNALVDSGEAIVIGEHCVAWRRE